MALCAARRTSTGTSVSHTPCDRLLPPTRAHSIDMLRISDCMTHSDFLLKPNGIEQPPDEFEPQRRVSSQSACGSLNIAAPSFRALPIKSVLCVFASLR